MLTADPWCQRRVLMAAECHAAGLFQHVPELMVCQPRLLEAFRTGDGFTYDDMGSTNVCATCRCALTFEQREHCQCRHAC